MEGIQKKVVVIGPTDVGKTALTLRYVNGTFCETSSTIGASFLMKKIVMGGNKLTLQIWDTAGQERFKSMAALYFRSSSAALLVCDITNEESLEQLDSWVSELKKHVGPEVVLAVAGNKCDLPERQITLKQGQDFAHKYNAPYFDTSAKNGTGVNDAFNYIAKQLMKASETAQPQPVSSSPATVSIQPNDPKAGEKSGCC